MVTQHTINFIDPCPILELTLASPKIFTSETYYLRDDELKFEWNQDNLVEKNSLVYCGELIVEIFMDDTSAFDEEIFTREDQMLFV